MSTPNSNNVKPVHHLVQLSYATPLIAQRSVLLAGDSLPLAEFAAQTGANVVAVSPSAPSPPWPRLRPEDGIAHHTMPLTNLAFDDGVFGAAIVPNLSLLENPTGVLSELRRILARDGYLIAATPNPAHSEGQGSAIDYYKMYELLAEVFPSVQMIGQSVFNGFAVADLADEDGELEVSFNSELIGNEVEEIAWFVAVCGNRKAALESYAIIQVPSSACSSGPDPAEFVQLTEELANAKRELGNRGVRIESLEKKLEEELMQSEAARERAVKLAKELDNERKAVTKKTLEDEFSKRSADIDLAGALHAAKKALKQAEERANSAESARDEIIERMRLDAVELEKVRRKLDEMEARPRRDPELEKKARLAEERAQSAESARDQLIDRMRAEGAELNRLRDKLEAMASRPSVPARDPELEKKARLAEERAQSAESARDELIDRLRSEAAELGRLRDKLEALEARPAVPARDPELEKKVRLAEERAKAAESARDELIDRMRADGAELSKLRLRYDETVGKVAALEKAEAVQREEIVALKQAAANARAEAEAARIAADEAQKAAALRVASALEKQSSAPTSPPPAGPSVELQEEIAALEKENQDLEKKLALTAEKKRAAEDEAARQTIIVRDLVVKLEALGDAPQPVLPTESTNDAAKERIAALETELAALWGAKAGEHRARVEAELELTGRMVEIERFKDNLAVLNLQLRTRDEELKRMTEERDALNAQSGELDDNSRIREMRVAELESELQSAKWRIDELAARKQDLENRLGEVEKEAVSLRDAMAETAKGDENLSKTLEEREARIADLESEMQRLTAGLESARRRERMLDEETESLTARSKQLREDLDNALMRLESSSRDLASANAEREQMTDTLRDLTAQLETEKAERAHAVETAGSMTEELSGLRAKLKQAEVELTGAHEKISDLSRAAASLQDETGRIQEVLDALDRRQAEVAELREKLVFAEQQIESERAKSEALRADLDALHRDLDIEADRTKQAGADAARISGEAEAFRERLERSLAELAERDAEVETDIALIAALREEIHVLSSKLRTARADEARMSRINAELETLRAETMKLSRELSDKEVELKQKTAALFEKESSLSDKESDLGDKISTLVEKESNLSEMQTTLMEKESKLQEKEGEIQEKIAALAALKEREEELLTELSKRRRELDEAAETLSAMEAKIVAVNQSKVGLSAELADAIQNGERFESELRKLQARLLEVEAETETLKVALSNANSASGALAEAAETVKKLETEASTLQQNMKEKESLITSLTEQLEERERRAAKLERQNRSLNEQIQEHEGDVSAWDMELKLRSARISQLEKELAEAKGK